MYTDNRNIDEVKHIWLKSLNVFIPCIRYLWDKMSMCFKRISVRLIWRNIVTLHTWQGKQAKLKPGYKKGICKNTDQTRKRLSFPSQNSYGSGSFPPVFLLLLLKMFLNKTSVTKSYRMILTVKRNLGTEVLFCLHSSIATEKTE